MVDCTRKTTDYGKRIKKKRMLNNGIVD